MTFFTVVDFLARPVNWIAENAKPWQILAFTFVVLSVLGQCCGRPEMVLANNDGPLGTEVAAYNQWPEVITGAWGDLNWLGYQVLPSPPGSVDGGIRTLCRGGWLNGLLILYVLVIFILAELFGSLRACTISALVWSITILVSGMLVFVRVDYDVAKGLVSLGGLVLLVHIIWVLLVSEEQQTK